MLDQISDPCGEVKKGLDPTATVDGKKRVTALLRIVYTDFAWAASRTFPFLDPVCKLCNFRFDCQISQELS